MTHGGAHAGITYTYFDRFTKSSLLKTLNVPIWPTCLVNQESQVRSSAFLQSAGDLKPWSRLHSVVAVGET